jgi:hypothetical protein
LPHKADLRRDTYDAIAKLIAPAVVMDNLRALYGSALDGAQYLHGSDVPFERRIALQFAHIHQQVTNPGAQDGSAPAQRSTGTDGAMPLVACLGWGSLVWNPGDLPREGDWRTDGPMLPIEFARQSTKGASAGALTLVLVPGYESQAQSLWVPLRVKDAAAGREALGKRERIPEEDWGTAIAVWEAPDSNAPIAGLADWARARGIGAVVWTALPPRFEGKSNRVPTADEAVAYLRQLSGEQKKNAEQYVRKAPGQIDTPYRRRFVTEFDWTANGK